MNEKKGILEKTAKEYYLSGTEELSKQRYNSAVVLFFKSLIASADLFLLIKTGKTPSSHNDRFNSLRNFRDIYDIVDKDFPFYQDSYNILMSKELAEVIKEDAEEVAGKAEITL